MFLFHIKLFLAETTIEGNLYSGTTNTFDQPRYDQSTCLSCTTGTVPNVDGQRFANIFNGNTNKLIVFFFLLDVLRVAKFHLDLSQPCRQSRAAQQLQRL